MRMPRLWSGRRLLRTLAVGFAGLTGLGLLAVWWTYPKRAVDSIWIRPSRGAFTFADLPKGRVLSADEVDRYARRLLASMSLPQKVLQMSGDTWLWDYLTTRWVGRPWDAGADSA